MRMNLPCGQKSSLSQGPRQCCSIHPGLPRPCAFPPPHPPAPTPPGLPPQPLTKRDELSLRRVLALPKASMAGLASMIWSSRVPWWQDEGCRTQWSWVLAHPRPPLLGKGKGKGREGPQDFIIIACPTHTGPIPTPVFVARNCWEEKEDNVRACEVSPGGGVEVGEWGELAGH